MKAIDLLKIVGVFIGVLIFNMIVNDFMTVEGTSIALITAGFVKTCTARSGGVKNIWFANRTEIATAGFTFAGGEYTAVTMESGKVFYKFEFDEDTADFRPGGSIENQSTLVTSEIEYFLGKMSTLMRNSLQDLLDISPCGLVGIVEDNNNVKWVVGYSENHKSKIDDSGRPLKVTTIEGATGKIFTDPNGSNVIMTATNNQLPVVFTGTVPVT